MLSLSLQCVPNSSVGWGVDSAWGWDRRSECMAREGDNAGRREEAPLGGKGRWVSRAWAVALIQVPCWKKQLQGCRVEKGVTCPAWEKGWGGPCLPTARRG